MSARRGVGAAIFAITAVMAAAGPARAQQPQYWYYCDDPKGYFPYVQNCKTNWQEREAASETFRLQQEAEKARREEAARQEKKRRAAELAAAKAAGFPTVEAWRAAQEAERKSQAELKAARAAGYADAAAFEAALNERADLDRRATSPSYDDLARNPVQHNGEVVRLVGRVIEAVYDAAGATLRIEITKTNYGWKDVILCVYQPVSEQEPRTLQNDVVKLWGIFNGIASYPTISGQAAQVPKISARFLERIGAGQS